MKTSPLRYILFFFILLFCINSITLAAKSTIKPPSKIIQTTGFWQEMHRITAVDNNHNRSGKEIYQYRCYGCHGKNTQGAPMPGDVADWKERQEQGMKALMRHTTNGFGDFMPPKGGCRNCNNAELKAAVLYMIKQKTITLQLPN